MELLTAVLARLRMGEQLVCEVATDWSVFQNRLRRKGRASYGEWSVDDKTVRYQQCSKDVM